MFTTLLQITNPAATTTVADTLTQTAQVVVPTAPTEDSFQLIELIMKGGPIMIPIGLLSVLTIYILIERFMTIRKASKIDPLFMHNIKDLIHNGNMDAAKATCKATYGPLARMVEKGISRIGKPIKEIEAAMESVGKAEVYKLEKNTSILSIIGKIAPILGFVGTIMGVIVIFYDIGLTGDIAIKTISKGLYQKMITSASGLVVGLLSYISYYIINTMLDKAIQNMELGAAEFIDLLQEPTK
ncbi:MAG: MotA/TolQ/ExbB proton channel family protein [Bacteroidetes bacterium]|nr:MotA/TolQ/ExbB proton channel family protein [Bacteroidota bacterium]